MTTGFCTHTPFPVRFLCTFLKEGKGTASKKCFSKARSKFCNVLSFWIKDVRRMSTCVISTFLNYRGHFSASWIIVVLSITTNLLEKVFDLDQRLTKDLTQELTKRLNKKRINCTEYILGFNYINYIRGS